MTSRIFAQPDYQCPTCGKVLVHLAPDAPVTHLAPDDHQLEGQRLEAITIANRHLWALGWNAEDDDADPGPVLLTVRQFWNIRRVSMGNPQQITLGFVTEKGAKVVTKVRTGRPRKYHKSRPATPAERQRACRKRSKRSKLPVYLRHDSDEWATPLDKFEALHAEFGFTIDVAAQPGNAKCPRFYSPEQDGLHQDWRGEVVFCNPPYSQVKRWIAKAYESSKAGATVVCIVNAAVDTTWWHDYVIPYAERWEQKGRWKFVKPEHKGGPATRPTMVVIFRPPNMS